MGTLGGWISNFYKAYVMKNLVQDVSKFVGRNIQNLDFDKEAWLNRAGLASYKPVRSTVGVTSLFLFGALTGAVLGLILAPKPGAELRQDVKDRALDLFNKTADSHANAGSQLRA